MHNLFKNAAVMRCCTEIAAGSSHYETKVIDTLGYNGLAFIAEFGTNSTAGTNGIHAEMSDSSGGGSSGSTLMIDVEDSGTTGGGDVLQGSICVLDLGRPKKRYYQGVVDRATGNSVITSVLAIKYNPVHAAVEQSTAADSLVMGSNFLYDETTGASTGS